MGILIKLHEIYEVKYTKIFQKFIFRIRKTIKLIYNFLYIIY